MRKLTPARILSSLALLFAVSHAATAQVEQDARGALTPFPDSQAVLYVNARRIINEMLPRVMPPAEYRKMLADAQKAGFDARELDYAAVGVRFAEPAPASGLPEFVVVVRGGFNADTLLALARVGLESEKAKRRQESYGSKTLEIIDTSNPDKPAEAAAKPGEQPKPAPYPEVAFTTLDSNTLVFGVPNYVKAAIDSQGGQGRLKTSTLDLATNDPQALWSLTADIPPTLAEYLHKYGAPANQELDQMLGWMKQISLSQGMTALDFTLRAALLTDQPEHASAFSGLVRMGLLAAQTALSQEAAKKRSKDAVNARQALAALKTVVNRIEGSTLVLGVSVPQKVVADLVRSEMNKSKAAAAKAKAKRRTGRKAATRKK
ncbi:MAG TPA: hypothetical protein VEX60_14930 [Pyrinomonadaceae bacterium]|nr:hypothetical protein [Pyrinomonadaceae bacterium]